MSNTIERGTVISPCQFRLSTTSKARIDKLEAQVKALKLQIASLGVQSQAFESIFDSILSLLFGLTDDLVFIEGNLELEATGTGKC